MAASGSSSDFPLLEDGDVTLRIPSGDVFKLHSHTLRRCSGFFADILTPENAAELKRSVERAGICTRYRLDLEASPEHPNGMFQMKTLDRYGHSSSDNSDHNIFAVVYGPRVSETSCKQWKNLLGAFYGNIPEINENNLQTVLESCVGLVDIAESIRASAAISQSVDIALMRQGQILYRSIAANPVEWGNLSVRIRSPAIFRDAVIHLVGKWNGLKEIDRTRLTGSLRELCEKKNTELNIQKKAIELRILGHYPASLHRISGTTDIGRSAYANDIYMWMAIDIYRQWFSQAISEGINWRARDGGAAFYRAIGAACDAYLGPRDYANFHNIFQMTSKGRTILNKKLNAFKLEVRPFVKAILENESQLDVEAEGALQHLTCCKVTRKDLPWDSPQEGGGAGDNFDGEKLDSHNDKGTAVQLIVAKDLGLGTTPMNEVEGDSIMGE